jgi:hypothetical protein
MVRVLIIIFFLSTTISKSSEATPRPISEVGYGYLVRHGTDMKKTRVELLELIRSLQTQIDEMKVSRRTNIWMAGLTLVLTGLSVQKFYASQGSGPETVSNLASRSWKNLSGVMAVSTVYNGVQIYVKSENIGELELHLTSISETLRNELQFLDMVLPLETER